MAKDKQHPKDPHEFEASEPAGLAERPTDAASGDICTKKVAVIIADGFEQSEFAVPVKRMRDCGVTVEVLGMTSAHMTHIEGESEGEPSAGTQADKLLSDARAEDYDALLIPGGLKSPDTMRQSSAHLDFVRAFLHAGKPIAAICHGPWLLADADALAGRTVTSWPGIRRDLERAGATWVDREVAQDGPLIFSRNPQDAEAFAKRFIEALTLVPTSRAI